MTAQRMSADPWGRFPSRITPHTSPDRSRAAWCYGDPGVAATLWSAAARLGLDVSLARETARDAAARPAETCGVVDAGLCHGAAGLAHLMNRYYQASRDTAFADAARTWLMRAIELVRPDGFGGIAAWHGDRSATPWQPNASFLEGAIGVALTWLAAVQAIEPCWDRLLLCDLPTEDTAHGTDQAA